MTLAQRDIRIRMGDRQCTATSHLDARLAAHACIETDKEAICSADGQNLFGRNRDGVVGGSDTEREQTVKGLAVITQDQIPHAISDAIRSAENQRAADRQGIVDAKLQRAPAIDRSTTAVGVGRGQRQFPLGLNQRHATAIAAIADHTA